MAYIMAPADTRWEHLGNKISNTGGMIANQMFRQNNMELQNKLQQERINERFGLLQAQRDHEMKAQQEARRLQSGRMFGDTIQNAGANGLGSISIDGKYTPENTGLLQPAFNQLKMHYDTGESAQGTSQFKPQYDYKGGSVYKDGKKTDETYDIINTKDNGEFERLLAKANLSKEKKDSLRKDRLLKLSQANMNSDAIKFQTAERAQEGFAKYMGLNSPYELSTVDTREWNDVQKTQANQVASKIIKGFGSSAKLVDKKMASYNAMLAQANNAISAYESVGEFRLLDEGVKKYFSNYFGLSEDELASTEASQAFQSLMNISINADAGKAVSAHEMVRKTLEVATGSMTKQKILLGIRNLAKRNVGELNGLKDVMGPNAFNLKYGRVLSNYEDLADAVKGEEKTSEVENIQQLRNERDSAIPQNVTSQNTAVQRPSREEAYNTIASQRPNATKEQIDNYLISKGY